MGKKSLSLEVEYDYDFDLIGIVSSVRDYRVCWHLNQTLQLNLNWKEDLKVEKKDKKLQTSYFNLYYYHDEINRAKYYLVGNKALGDYLIAERKEIDYFLQITGYNSLREKERILDDLKGINVIEAVFGVDPLSLKSKQNLVFE